MERIPSGARVYTRCNGGNRGGSRIATPRRDVCDVAVPVAMSLRRDESVQGDAAVPFATPKHP